ncbi:MAG TPA: hypothetical protein VGF17_09595 [Phytomonospora sp.]
MKKIVVLIVAAALAATLAACTGATKSQTEGQKLTEQAFAQQSSAVPYPADKLRDSLERRNLRERLLRQNEADRIGYVYILSFGKFIGYYTIKGKVSSTQSQMTTEDLISKPCDSCDRFVIAGPGDDGSYGDNEPGVFFFTTNGTMVQVSTDYIYSDQPIAVGNIPELG